MSTSTVGAASPRHPFGSRVESVKPSKSDINSVVMDYLISEGFPAAARSFAKEANIPQESQDAESIQVRVDIKKAIHTGNIDEAIGMINELNPEILDQDHGLHFALLRLQLIELIRASRNSSNQEAIITAINFARDHLAPRASVNPQFKQDLEHAMCLIVFAPDKIPAKITALLDPQLKQEVADAVNQAILDSYGRNKEARIKALIKLRAWAEQKAREAGKDAVPPTLAIDLDNDGATGQDSAMHENGQSGLEADVMVP